MTQFRTLLTYAVMMLNTPGLKKVKRLHVNNRQASLVNVEQQIARLFKMVSKRVLATLKKQLWPSIAGMVKSMLARNVIQIRTAVKATRSALQIARVVIAEME